DSTMVGRPVLVNGNPHTLVGVLPDGVTLYGMDLWTVMPVPPSAISRGARQYQLMARLREGVTLAEANAELEVLARRTEQQHRAELAEYEGWSLRALGWNEVSSRAYRTGAFVLLGAVAFLLLLVCANT